METSNDSLRNSKEKDDTSKEQDSNVDVPESSGNTNPTATSKDPLADHVETVLSTKVETDVPTVRPSIHTATTKDITSDQVEPVLTSTVETEVPTVSSPAATNSLSIPTVSSNDPRIISRGGSSYSEAPSLGNAMTFKDKLEDFFGDTSNSASLTKVEADLSNMETRIQVSPTPTLRINKDHPKNQIIGHIDTPVQTKHRAKHMEEQGVRPIGTKWVLKNKRDERGIVIRNKARFVAQGYTQEEGIDYKEVFIPVARIEAIRLFLAYALYMGFTVYQMDVKSTFLYGTIDEEVYVKQPPGFEDPEFPNRVYRVEKAMYGLHQAPRAWYVYVDDIIFGSSNPKLCKEFEVLMHEKFKMSAMGELTFFLGLQVLQNKDGIFILQDKYIGDILKKFGYTDVRTTKTSMDRENPWGKDGPGKYVDLYLYRSMIRSLMYLTALRPDIMFVVCVCARHQVTPKECHLHAVKRIFSDYNGDNQDRKSTTRGCQFLGRRLISWQCKKQTIVATSTTEAKYVAAASGCRQVLWIQNQLLDYGYNFMNTKIYIHNNSAICIVKNLVYHSRTKHIDIRHHFIRDCYEKKLINVDHIHTDDNVADLLTKPFDVGRFQYLVVSIGMVNP
ncbi:putative ribonuclease H-like domain-containing protein [Tanacetum coccineum]